MPEVAHGAGSGTYRADAGPSGVSSSRACMAVSGSWTSAAPAFSRARSGFARVELLAAVDEGMEGAQAFAEERDPDFPTLPLTKMVRGRPAAAA